MLGQTVTPTAELEPPQTTDRPTSAVPPTARRRELEGTQPGPPILAARPRKPRAQLPVNPRLPDAKVAAAMCDPYDRRILGACIAQAKAVREIETATGLPPATLYRRVAALVEAGLLVLERSAISGAGKRYDLYRSRVRSARLELGPDGLVVQWEPVEALEERLTHVWAYSGPVA